MDKKTKNLIITVLVVIMGIVGLKLGLSEDVTKQIQAELKAQKEVETTPSETVPAEVAPTEVLPAVTPAVEVPAE